MPLKSDTVEAASRTLLLLEELNRHRVTSIDRLHKAIVGAPAHKTVRERFAQLGFVADGQPPDQHASSQAIEAAAWAAVITQAGIAIPK